MNKIQLENNIPIFHLESSDHLSKKINFGIWFKVGSRNDNPNYLGAAHLIEHCMLRLKLHETLTLKEFLLQNTIEYKLLTSIDFILLRFTCHEENILDILKKIKSAFDNIQISTQDFLQEKELILNEMEIKFGTQRKKFFDSLRENLWSSNIGHPILGDMIDVSSVNIDQVKNTIHDIWKNEEFFMLYTGNLPIETVKNLFQLSPAKNTEFNHPDALLINSGRSELNSSRKELIIPDYKVVNTSMVYELDSDLVASKSLLLPLLSRLISFGDMGFLSKILRDGGHPIYYVMAFPLSFKYEDTLVINFIARKEYIPDITKSIHNAINNLENHLNSVEKYFEVAKQGFLNDISKSQKSDFGSMNYIGQALLYNRTLNRLNETNEEIANVTFSELKNFARNVILNNQPLYFTTNGEEISYD